MIPRDMPGYSPNIGIEFDAQRGRELLRKAGYPDGKGFPELEIFTHPGGATRGKYLCDAWQKYLGIHAHCRVLDFAELIRSLDNEPPAIFMTGWTASMPDPIAFLRGPLEVEWFGDEVEGYRELVEASTRVSNPEDRARAYQGADRQLIESGMLIPLNYARRNLLVKPHVIKFPVPALGNWFLKDVLLQQPEQSL
ncbi:MAG: hypothetical protein DWQ07_17180 [Chloroflexi bacterium]|nr:MAG: hypothetical protein DWQ07_17180 [Chloroflexota bacterium]MBL1195139.1 hypothetical protein [Chloroflexota bacterium]NOH12424.1 hypothetical protein [Chloroflexota bacterium]